MARLGITSLSPVALIAQWLKRRRHPLVAVCSNENQYISRLQEIWKLSAESPTPSNGMENANRDWLAKVGSCRKPPPLDWKIAFTAAFSKAIALADRSLQGRVLLALAELSSDPATPRGDTIKRLVGDKDGLWRYRLGDYRLVYEPQPSNRMVVLIDFAPRSGVYD